MGIRVLLGRRGSGISHHVGVTDRRFQDEPCLWSVSRCLALVAGCFPVGVEGT